MRVSDQIKRSDQWPKAANKSSNRRRRAAPGLRSMGLQVTEHDRNRRIRWALRKPLQSTVNTVGPISADETDGSDDSLQPRSEPVWLLKILSCAENLGLMLVGEKREIPARRGLNLV